MSDKPGDGGLGTDRRIGIWGERQIFMKKMGISDRVWLGVNLSLVVVGSFFIPPIAAVLVGVGSTIIQALGPVIGGRIIFGRAEVSLPTFEVRADGMVTKAKDRAVESD